MEFDSMILKKLKSLIKTPESKSTSNSKHELSLAVAALMVEIMQSDDSIDDDEQNKIYTSLEKRFELTAQDIQELIVRAQEVTKDATDFHQFTSQIKDNYSVEERISIVTDLWGIAMADGHIDTYEEHLIRRISNLIGVYHDEFIHAKIQAKKKL